MVEFLLCFDIRTFVVLHILIDPILCVENWKSRLAPLRSSHENVENRLLNHLIRSTNEEDSIETIGEESGPATAGLLLEWHWTPL